MPQIHPCNKQECNTFDEIINHLSIIFSPDDPNIRKFPSICQGDIDCLKHEAIPYLMIQTALRVVCTLQVYDLLPYAILYNDKQYVLYLTGKVVKHESRQCRISILDTGIVDSTLMTYRRADISKPDAPVNLLTQDIDMRQYGLSPRVVSLCSYIEDIEKHLNIPIFPLEGVCSNVQ